MATVQAEEVYTRDVTSGRAHKRYRIPGQDELYTLESDNLDAAGEYEVITELDAIEADDLCARCFPPAGP